MALSNIKIIQAENNHKARATSLLSYFFGEEGKILMLKNEQEISFFYLINNYIIDNLLVLF
jgi:hypothetical protein